MNINENDSESIIKMLDSIVEMQMDECASSYAGMKMEYRMIFLKKVLMNEFLTVSLKDETTPKEREFARSLFNVITIIENL